MAAEAGLNIQFVFGDDAEKRYLIEANGGGVAFVDFDGDGWLDVFFVNGSTFKPTASKATSKLYRNTGEGKFADVSANAGVARAGWGSGVCAGDYDGDGTTVIRGELRALGGADEIEFGVEYQKSLGFAEVMYNGMDGDCDAEDDGAGLI